MILVIKKLFQQIASKSRLKVKLIKQTQHIDITCQVRSTIDQKINLFRLPIDGSGNVLQEKNEKSA